MVALPAWQKLQPVHRRSLCSQYHSLHPALHGPADAGLAGAMDGFDGMVRTVSAARDTVGVALSGRAGGDGVTGGDGGGGAGPLHFSQSRHASFLQLAVDQWHHEAHWGGTQLPISPVSCC